MKVLGFLSIFAAAIGLVFVIAFLPTILETQAKPTGIALTSATPIATKMPQASSTSTILPPTETPIPTNTNTVAPSATPTETATSTPSLGEKGNPIPVEAITGTVTIAEAARDGESVVFRVNEQWYVAKNLLVIKPVVYYGVTGQGWKTVEETVFPVAGELVVKNGYVSLFVPYDLQPADSSLNAVWEDVKDKVAKAPVNYWDTSPFGRCLTMISVWRNIGWGIGSVSKWAAVCYGPDEAQGLPVRVGDKVVLDSLTVGNTSIELWYNDPWPIEISYSVMLRDGIEYPDIVVAPNVGLRNCQVKEETVGCDFINLETGSVLPFSVTSDQVYIIIQGTETTDTRAVMVFRVDQ